MSDAAHGRLAAMLRLPWAEISAALAQQRRERLAAWLEVVVSLDRNGAKDLAVFHAKQRRGKAPWDGAEIDLLRLGCEMAAPKPLLAALLGRSHVAVRSKAKNCGFTRRVP